MTQDNLNKFIFKATQLFFEKQFSPTAFISMSYEMVFESNAKDLRQNADKLSGIFHQISDEVSDIKGLNLVKRVLIFQEKLIKACEKFFKQSITYTLPTHKLSNRHLPVPTSYIQISNDHRNDTPLKRARGLLDDYTKSDSSLARFFTGHWNRHHTREIAEIVKAIDDKTITSVAQLITLLKLIPLKNSQGSLAKRINFIEKNILIDELNSSPSFAFTR